MFVTVLHHINDPEGFVAAEDNALEAGLPTGVALPIHNATNARRRCHPVALRRGTTMPRYLFEANDTPEGVRGLEDADTAIGRSVNSRPPES